MFASLLFSLSLAAWGTTSETKLYQGCLERIAQAHTLDPERLRAVLLADSVATVCLKNVPSRFKTHPDFHRLAYDPDRKLISAQTIREAMAAIEAVQLGLVPGPITRAPAGSSADYYDGLARPFDVKCYSSPRSAKGTPVDPSLLVRWIEEKLNRDPAMQVLLDRTYLTQDDYLALKQQMKKVLDTSLLTRVLELVLPEPILRLHPRD